MNHFENVAEFYRKTIYGIDTYYPSNQLATFVCRLSRTKTLTDHAISVLQAYGVEIEIVAQEIQQPAFVTASRNVRMV